MNINLPVLLKSIKLKSKTAFSLIELSIVILIIGILVAGVTQSSRLVSRIKLFTAQSLTISSEITSINNLTLWLETSLDKSLTNSLLSFDVENNNQIQSWNDINPQSSSKINIIQNTSANQPIYTSNGINGLPSISFNGSSQYLISMNNIPINLGDKDYTLVMVWNANSVNFGSIGQVVISQSDNPGVCNQLSCFWINAGTYGFAGGCNDFRPTPVFQQTNYIGIITINNNLASNNVSIYTNSNTPTTGTTSGGSASLNIGAGHFAIGSRYQNGSMIQYYNGLLSEILVFDRALKIDEIRSVNAYLSKKYSIKVS